MISATIRDIAIILLAIQTLIVNILLAILIWQVWRMVKMMQSEVKPIVEDTQDTLGSVRGTANFVGNNVVDPVVRANRTLVGLRTTARSLFADLRPQRVTPSGAGAPPAPAAEAVNGTAVEPVSPPANGAPPSSDSPNNSSSPPPADGS